MVSSVCSHRAVSFYFTDESEPSLVINMRSVFILPTSQNRHSSSSLILYPINRILSTVSENIFWNSDFDQKPLTARSVF